MTCTSLLNLSTYKKAKISQGRKRDMINKNNGTHQILIDNSITGSKECQDMWDKVPLLRLQLLPVGEILREINFFSCPEGSLSFLVHLPDVMVLDREDYKTTRILLQKGLILLMVFQHILAGLLEERIHSCTDYTESTNTTRGLEMKKQKLHKEP